VRFRSRPLKKAKTIEVGNIFLLKDKFSRVFNLVYKDKNGKDKFVQMGCYGIGISRVMGAIVEVHHDERGIVWPDAVTPYDVHLIILENAKKEADKIYKELEKAGIDVLYDDREETSAGEKFADADLIGIPVRLVASDKTQNKVDPDSIRVEWKKRTENKTELLGFGEAVKRLKTKEEKEL